MMDASLPADQSGLSDLSAASIASIGPYLRPTSPVDDERTPATTSTSALLDPATPLPASSQTTQSAILSATPGPSRISQVQSDTSGAAWTSSPPETSASRSSIKHRSSRRSSPIVKDGNESMGSSLGTFDFSNASFSESFLRQAGAHMLAGLDETDLPPTSSSSSSPRYRTSSSPTVTARPIRADPRTPFTGKSLRTRMAEAGMINSPASSDGSSPSRSPTSRVLPNSGPSSFAALESSEDKENHRVEPYQDSPRIERFHAGYPSSPVGNEGQALHELDEDSLGATHRSEWQEGLSMVPEESFVEDASQLPSSPALPQNDSRKSMILDAASSPSVLRAEDSQQEQNASDSSIPAPDPQLSLIHEASPAITAPSPAKSDYVETIFSDSRIEEKKQEHSNVVNTPANPTAVYDSPRSSFTAPTTPKSAPRTASTPRSFARLRMVTPARSSPLSRVVNFSPSSAGGSSQWQSPASQQSVQVDRDATPLNEASAAEVPKPNETTSSSVLSRQAPATGEPATPAERNASQIGRVIDSPTVEKVPQHHIETASRSSPKTPRDDQATHVRDETPSRFWSPATSAASFSTPASRGPPEALSFTPMTPALPESLASTLPTTPKEAFSSPASNFGTPQWTPSPAPISEGLDQVEGDKDNAQAETSLNKTQHDDEEPSSSSACSSTSERKQSGDVSTTSQPVADASHQKESSPSSVDKKPMANLSLVSNGQHDSPSAARFSRLQLSRITSSASPIEIPAVPELGLVANAFTSLTHLSDSRVSRLLAQLSASTARIEELESALDARDREVAEVDDLRHTLSQLSTQYQELVDDADHKDAHMAELVKSLQSQLESRSKESSASELERQLEEEMRLREVERRDYEVRIAGLLNPTHAAPTPTPHEAANAGPQSGRQTEAEVEQAKERLRLTLEKDFEIRRAMEQRELQERIEELERELAARPVSAAESSRIDDMDSTKRDEEILGLKRQNEELTVELDRRFEELADVREELDSLAAQHDQANDRIAQLEEELAEARTSTSISDHPHSNSQGNAEMVEELQEELDALRADLAERDAQIENLEETLSLTNARLTSLTHERDELQQQHKASQTQTAALQSHVASLESHVLTLETQLRTPRTPEPAAAQPTVYPAPGTPAPERVQRLEREVASLHLELVKLGRAHDALQEDNVHFSIALSAKQLELGMVKRNARFALKNAHAQRQAQAQAQVQNSIGLPQSKTARQESAKETNDEKPRDGLAFPRVPSGELGVRAAENKENEPAGPPVPVNEARQHARQLLAQRRALGAQSSTGGQERRQRLALAA